MSLWRFILQGSFDIALNDFSIILRILAIFDAIVITWVLLNAVGGF